MCIYWVDIYVLTFCYSMLFIKIRIWLWSLYVTYLHSYKLLLNFTCVSLIYLFGWNILPNERAHPFWLHNIIQVG